MSRSAAPETREDHLVELVEQARAGDLDAFESIVAALQGPVRGFVRRMLRDADDGDDAAQEVFVRVWKGLSSYRARGRFVAWVFAIAHNICIDQMRRRARRPIPAELEHVAIPDPTDGVDLRVVLEHAIAELGEPLRSTLLLRKAGLAYDEVAEALGCPIGTVRWRLHEAKRQLAIALSPITGGEA